MTVSTARGRCGRAAAAVAIAGALAGCGGPMSLAAPDIAPAVARTPSPVDVEPVVAGTAIVGDFAAPGPAAVLTAAMNGELRGRALHGGSAGGITVRCTLDRFAARSRSAMTVSQDMLALYVDLSCDASRSVDHVPVWRGELRARTFSQDANVLGSDAHTAQRLLDRALADAARELASDLAVRALGLGAEPSARVFADADAQKRGAGLDDTPFGAAALQETGAAGESVAHAMTDTNATLRAAAWNVVAMAAGPGDPWTAAAELALDDDARVRFVQYKALARHGTPAALKQLSDAAARDDEPLLVEMAKDAVASGGIGLPRASAGRAQSSTGVADSAMISTNGATTSP